jgi:acyl-phosphate glycerol 3-phosphate acyltransferase
MSAIVTLGITMVIAYLIGSMPFGFLVARWRGVDIFKQGSGNIGATNVGRVLGRRFGLLVFALDFAKGALPTLATRLLPVPADDSLAMISGQDGLGVAAGLAAVVGHMFPIYLRFRGGKGVATGAGVVSVLLPVPALAALVTWVALVSALRYVSVASVGAAAVLCLVRLGLTNQPWAGSNRILTLFCFVAMALVVLRHRANITRLLHGNENRLRETPAMTLLAKIIHVLSVGFWFGTTVFFSFVVGLSLFSSFESVSEKPRDRRPLWFPLPAEFDKPRPSDRFPDPLRKEQGSRAAGMAVSPMFDWYFGIQSVCGVLAVATALPWVGLSSKVHKTRVVLLLLALLTVAVGWYLDQKVSELRMVRNDASDEVLRSDHLGSDTLAKADDARTVFGRWHGYSLMCNMATVLLVTIAMSLTAALPGTQSPSGLPKATDQ